ncbi:hypothetical protein HPP92_027979, partial [Vanilla planifolia]
SGEDWERGGTFIAKGTAAGERRAAKTEQRSADSGRPPGQTGISQYRGSRPVDRLEEDPSYTAWPHHEARKQIGS